MSNFYYYFAVVCLSCVLSSCSRSDGKESSSVNRDILSSVEVSDNGEQMIDISTRKDLCFLSLKSGKAKEDVLIRHASGTDVAKTLQLFTKINLNQLAKDRLVVDEYLKVRQDVYEKLLYAQRLLPNSWNICVLEGYRSLRSQDMLFRNEYEKLHAIHNDWDEVALVAEVSKSVMPVSNLDKTENFPSHSTGGAVDLCIVDADGKIVDLGYNVEDVLFRNLKIDTNTDLSEEVQSNRKFVSKALVDAGFVNRDDKYSHWSYGDRYWALKNKRAAIYDSVLISSDVVSALDNALLKGIERKFNGVVLVAKSDKVLYQKAFGEYGAPALDSQFMIGAISQQMMNTLLLKLVDDGKIKLDDPVKKYLDNLSSNFNDDLKIKHLLNHTSGILSMDGQFVFAPGTDFRYSADIDPMLVQDIIRKFGNPDEMMHELFVKAGMSDSVILSTTQKYNDLLQSGRFIESFNESAGYGITRNNVAMHDKDTKNSLSNIATTAMDLVKWNIALHDNKLLSEASYDALIATNGPVRDHPRYGKVFYGYGVQVKKSSLYNIDDYSVEISHSGYIPGYTATLLFYPRTQLTVVVLENISWTSTNLRRAFSLHDSIRRIILSSY